MKVFSFDGETNDPRNPLWGQAFMVAASVTDDNGSIIATFVARCPIEGEVHPWVRDNVLDQVADVPITHPTYAAMLEAFYAFYLQHKGGAAVIAHMAFPVESRILRDTIEPHLPEAQWEGPYPLIDVSGVLDGKGFNPTSVDTYNSSHGLQVPFSGLAHHPLYDCLAADVCYRSLKA